MKLLLKNTKGSCNREEKQEEDDLLKLINFLQTFNIAINFLIGLKIKNIRAKSIKE